MAEQKIKEQQQLLQDDELSDDDNSMGSVLHIPTDTGINNSDSEPVAMDLSNNDDEDEEDQGSYHTKDGMNQEDLPTSNNMETNENEKEESGNKGNGRNADSDNRSKRSTKEDL